MCVSQRCVFVNMCACVSTHVCVAHSYRGPQAAAIRPNSWGWLYGHRCRQAPTGTNRHRQTGSTQKDSILYTAGDLLFQQYFHSSILYMQRHSGPKPMYGLMRFHKLSTARYQQPNQEGAGPASQNPWWEPSKCLLLDSQARRGRRRGTQRGASLGLSDLCLSPLWGLGLPSVA